MSSSNNKQSFIKHSRCADALHKDFDNNNFCQPRVAVESQIPNTRKGQIMISLHNSKSIYLICFHLRGTLTAVPNRSTAMAEAGVCQCSRVVISWSSWGTASRRNTSTASIFSVSVSPWRVNRMNMAKASSVRGGIRSHLTF